MRYADARSEAIECLDEYDSPGFALTALRRALDDPGELDGDADWRDALGLLGRVFDKLGYPALAAPSAEAAADPGDVERLYRAAYAFIEQQMAPLAATLLRRAHALAPGREDVLTELVAALESVGRFAAARGVLAAAARTSFHTQYLFAFDTLMSGDAAAARSLVHALTPAGPDESFMCRRLDDMLARYDAVAGVTPLDASDLRGWHFVASGGILLHCAPAGADESVHGRYGALEDSESLLLEGLRRLATVLDAWELRPARVLAFRDAESHRLGLAAAAVLGVPCTPAVLVPDRPGLFVIYDLGQVIGELLAQLRAHRPGQIVFAHAAPAARELPVSADVTTLLAARVVSPWSRHTIFPRRPELPSGPPTESDEVLAERIVRATLSDAALADLPQLRALALAARSGAAALQASGTRERHWAGSPVPGAGPV
jgi:hypothetical protein